MTKIVGKWNRQLRKYEDYALPKGAIIYSEDLNAPCTCAQCGKQITFGDGYTSLEVHNEIGFGYIVCEECYNEELKRKEKWKSRIAK